MLLTFFLYISVSELFSSDVSLIETINSSLSSARLWCDSEQCIGVIDAAQIEERQRILEQICEKVSEKFMSEEQINADNMNTLALSPTSAQQFIRT